MSVEPKPDLSEFAQFADTLRGHRAVSERVVRHALSRVVDRLPPAAREELDDVSQAFDGTLSDLDQAAEELRVQNEALFDARMELDSTSALFRDLFELAPVAYLVTTADTRVLYANQAACALLGRRKNGLAGKPLICHVPLEDRSAFRSAVLRSNSPGLVSEWSATLLPSGAAAKLTCRMRIRAVSAPGARSLCALYWNITEETDEDLF